MNEAVNSGTIAAESDRNGRETDSLPRPRDRDMTRLTLLRAARRRFAIDGYSSTTVRKIAGDAGVNVALINRYFDSKEGLFEACLAHAAEQFGRPSALTLEQAIETVIRRVAGPLDDEESLQLLLLMRSSGDERADFIRRRTLRSFAESIAALAGWTPDLPDGENLLLRAEVAICTVLGVTLLRSSSGLEPLSSATADDLAAPISEAFRALL